MNVILVVVVSWPPIIKAIILVTINISSINLPFSSNARSVLVKKSRETFSVFSGNYSFICLMTCLNSWRITLPALMARLYAVPGIFTGTHSEPFMICDTQKQPTSQRKCILHGEWQNLYLFIRRPICLQVFLCHGVHDRYEVTKSFWLEILNYDQSSGTVFNRFRGKRNLIHGTWPPSDDTFFSHSRIETCVLKHHNTQPCSPQTLRF